jgi:hypothetical protein
MAVYYRGRSFYHGKMAGYYGARAAASAKKAAELGAAGFGGFPEPDFDCRMIVCMGGIQHAEDEKRAVLTVSWEDALQR